MAEKNGTAGQSYNPAATGAGLGSKLNQYATTPAPKFDENLFVGPNVVENLGREKQYAAAYGGEAGLKGAFNYASDMAKGPAGPSLTEQRFGGTNYGTEAPGYQTLRNKLVDDVTTNNLAAFNNSGMFGSDDNRSSLAEGLTNGLAAMDMDQYQRGQALERQDVSAIEGMRQQGINNSMGAGASLGARYQDMLRPSQTFSDVGAAQRADQQGGLLGAYDQFGRTQNADYNRFLELLGAFGGSQGNAGMAEEVPLWQQMLGFGAQAVGSAFR